MRLPAFLKSWPQRDHRSRTHLLGGRLRLSTLGLLVAFIALFWVYETYSAPLQVPQVPVDQVVPPGYVPDPEYTWVPRTNVRTVAPAPTNTTTTTSPTTTTETTPPEDTTEPGEPGPDESTSPSPVTTVIDPDGPGPSNPQTFTQLPPQTSPQTPTQTPTQTPSGPTDSPTATSAPR